MIFVLLLFLLFPASALALTPVDFAGGYALEVDPGFPLQRLCFTLNTMLPHSENVKYVSSEFQILCDLNGICRPAGRNCRTI